MQSESFEQLTKLPPLNDGMAVVELFQELVDKRCAEWIESHPLNVEFEAAFKTGWYKAELAYFIMKADPAVVALAIQRYKEI